MKMSNEDINNEDDLNPGNYREEAPFLFGLKKEEPYSAPQGYFEKFRLELSEKIHQKKSGWWNFFFRPIVWAPTMVALIVAGIFLFKGENAVDPDKTAVKENTFELDNISFDVLDEYVNENLLAQARAGHRGPAHAADPLPRHARRRARQGQGDGEGPPGLGPVTTLVAVSHGAVGNPHFPCCATHGKCQFRTGS
jgi:hypothetical protein